MELNNMAICTQCGAIMHDGDMGTHVCAPEDLPVKGMEIKRSGDSVAQVSKAVNNAI